MPTGTQPVAVWGQNMPLELSLFDPDAIQAAMDADLVGGLRALAAALESGEMGGRLISAIGIGGRNDDNANVLIRIVVHAPIRTLRRTEDTPKLGSGLEKLT